jgi:hypothetical protein
MAAEGMMRPIARQYDEEEHTDPWEFFNSMWDISRANRDQTSMSGGGHKKKGARTVTPRTRCCVRSKSWPGAT